MKILIVDSDFQFTESIKTHLEVRDFQVDVVRDGLAGEEYASLGIYDLLIIEMMLPDINGLELTRRIRARHDGALILMSTENASSEDRISALESGADYFLSKPFDPRELLACIHALLRRHGSQFNKLAYGNTALDLSSNVLICGTTEIRLSAREFDVMRLLMQNPEHNHSKEMILSYVWGYDSNAVENHVEVYVGFLRKKLKMIGSDISIQAVRKLGYHLEVMNAKK